MKVLVTGSQGQLGQEFRKISSSTPFKFIFTDSSSLDITDKNAIQTYFDQQHIDVVINCAAYTAVDQAEDEEEKAFRINRDAVENLVEVCEKQRTQLIHFSTDYVFNGENCKPYVETDKVNPIGVYGKSKRAGEEVILNSNIGALIIRTSWLYSTHGKNFVKTMIDLGQNKDELTIIFDQIGTPTHTKDLVLASLKCLELNKAWENKREVYHFSNEGVTSWYDFALAIFEMKNITCDVKPILTSEFPTQAERPHFSLLNKNKIKTDFGVKIKHWRESLLSSNF